MRRARTTSINVRCGPASFMEAGGRRGAASLSIGITVPKRVRSHPDAHQTTTKLTTETAPVFR